MLFLLVRVWGGFTDLFAGRRVNETMTRWGRFRPYILFGSVALLVLLVVRWGKGIFFIQRELNDRFTTVMT